MIEFKNLHCFLKYKAINICDAKIIVQSKYTVKPWYGPLKYRSWRHNYVIAMTSQTFVAIV